MTKKIKNNKTRSKEIVKQFTKEALKKKMLNIWTYESHPDNIYKKLWEWFTKGISKMSNKEKEELWNKLSLVNNFSNNHINLANTVDNKLQTTVIELTNDIIKEYNCNTTLEKSLCEVIANSYWKIMGISKRLNSNLDFEYFWKERNQFLAILSKELDRANRNYLMSLNNLIEIKRPKMSLNIKTKNAYISQNQQINNNPKKDEEIINP